MSSILPLANKNMFKIAIRTLELALATLNIFRKKAPSYMFDGVLNTYLYECNLFHFQNIFVCRIMQLTCFTLFFLSLIEISWYFTKLHRLPIFHKYSTISCFRTQYYTMSKLYFNISWESHEKRKDSLETCTLLSIFLLELEMSGVAMQSIH